MTWMRTVVLTMVLALTTNLAMAGDDAKAKDDGAKVKKEPAPMVAVSVTGKIIEEKGTRTMKSKKEGVADKEVNYTRYWLEGEDGKKMPIAQPRAKKGEKPAVSLADYADKKVTIKGQGYVHTHKDRKTGQDVTKTVVKVIESVEEITE